MVLQKTTTNGLGHKLALLRALPLFSLVADATLKELAQLFSETTFEANQVIVQQHDVVDSVFIIDQGEAEVSWLNKSHKKQSPEALAILRAGEAIGLSDTGFYSSTGLRTATVKAITPVLAIRLALDDFKHFLSTHNHLNVEMLKAADTILRINFIKQVEPFQKIDPVLLKDLADHLKELHIPAGETIIKQGDVANHCYLLCSGSVEIILTKADGNTINLDTLNKQGTLFGETALLTNSKRNATVIAETECKLYELSREQFQKLTQSSAVSTSLIQLMMDRQRPVRIQGVTVHTRKDSENKTIVILKEAKRGNYFKTSEEGLFIWNLLNGDLTIIDIAAEYFYRYKVIALESIGNLIMQLMHSGFVLMPTLDAHIQKEKPSYWIRALKKVESVLTYTYSIYDVDGKLTRLYNRVGYLFYTKLAHIIMVLITITGITAFILFLPHTQHILKETPNAWVYLVWMTPISMLIIPFHELAHALTTKSYGRQVNRMGVGWFWLGPMAFTDTSDMWLSTRWPRIAVSFSGIYFNWIISGILSFVAWLLLPDFPHAASFIWLVAFSSYMMGYYNLDPTFELDGYYILMNYFDKPNLRGKAVHWLVDNSIHTFLHPIDARKYIPEITYWFANLFFIFLYAFTAYITYTYVLTSILPQKIGNHDTLLFRWIIIMIVIIISFTGIYFRIKRQRHTP